MRNKMCAYKYLVSDLDKEDEDNDDERIVDDADNSKDTVDHFERKIVYRIHIKNDIFRRGRCDVVPFITRQRRVLHRCCQLLYSHVSQPWQPVAYKRDCSVR